MFTVILLPLITLLLDDAVNSLFVWVLLPLYFIISVLLPYLALRLGRNIGRKYRSQVGGLKASVIESVYGVRDIQIFGIGQERKQDVLDKTAGGCPGSRSHRT